LSLKLVPISGDHYRSELLRRVCTADTIPVGEDAQPIIDLVQQRLVNLSEEFQQALDLKIQAYSRKRICLQRRKELLTTLDHEIRGFWSGLKWLMRRHQLPPSFAQMFRDNAEHQRPVARSTGKKLSVARNIIAGEIRSQVLGHPPMANPNLAKLTRSLEAVTEASNEVDRENRAYQLVRSQYAEIRDKVDKTLLDLVGYLRVAFRGQDQIQRRNLLRSLGFQFVSDQGQDKPSEPEATLIEPKHDQPLTEQDQDQTDPADTTAPAEVQTGSISVAETSQQRDGPETSSALPRSEFKPPDPPTDKNQKAA